MAPNTVTGPRPVGLDPVTALGVAVAGHAALAAVITRHCEEKAAARAAARAGACDAIVHRGSGSGAGAPS
jgi:hypothetical protein